MTSDKKSTSSSRPGRPAEKHVDDFLEIEQPERQLDVVGVEHLRTFTEAAPVFIVNVEHKNAQIGARLQYLLHQQRNGARLADTRCAENREMLAQHFVDFNAGWNVTVLMQMTDFDHARAGTLKDQPQFPRTDERNRIAHARI